MLYQSILHGSIALSSIHDHFAEHSGMHVVQEVAMPRPASYGIGGNEEAHALRRLHVDGVLAHLKLPVGTLQLVPHAVHMHGMGHHRVVVQDYAEALVAAEMHGCGLAELQSVDRPGEALHVAGQMQFDLPPESSFVERPADRVQVDLPKNETRNIVVKRDCDGYPCRSYVVTIIWELESPDSPGTISIDYDVRIVGGSGNS